MMMVICDVTTTMIVVVTIVIMMMIAIVKPFELIISTMRKVMSRSSLIPMCAKEP